jgi:hypothetical protein
MSSMGLGGRSGLVVSAGSGAIKDIGTGLLLEMLAEGRILTGFVCDSWLDSERKLRKLSATLSKNGYL